MQKLKEDILQLVDKRNVESSKETKKLIVLGKSLIKDYEG